MENLSHKIYTQSIQAPFLAMIGWLFQSHEHTYLPFLTELLEGLLHCLLLNSTTLALGFKWKNIWDGTKNVQPLALPYNFTISSANSLPQPKCQFIKAVHVEVAKEYEDMAADLVCKALHSTAFWHTTNLMMKQVLLYSDHIPLAQQDILCCSITKQSQNRPSVWQCLNTSATPISTV